MSVWDAVAAALGAKVESRSRVGGGDINEAFRVRLGDGREVFVKTNENTPPDMFEAESDGLEWLRAGPLRIPEVLAHGAQFLALELLVPARRRDGFDDELGRGLAELHRQSPGTFGHGRDNYIGRLPQGNEAEPDWPTFYRTRRLEPQLELAGRLIPKSVRRDFDRLFDQLAELVGPPEPAARLHGDLWGGNLHVDERGAPCLIDPAVYGGHREMDLAMMSLFGGFSRRVFDAYDEAHPTAPGRDERVPLYQLYPLLVHVNLFGGGYLGAVERALAAYV